MGWSFAIDRNHGKAAEVERLIRWQRSDDAVWTLVKHSVVGNHLWMVVKNRESGRVEVALYLLRSGWPHDGWGHKCVSHLDAFDCPLSLLHLLPMGEDPAEVAWRSGVHSFHSERMERRSKSASIRVGDMFQWREGRLVVELESRGGRHVQVAYQIQRGAEWWHCETYRAKRSMLAKLPVIHNMLAQNGPEQASQNEPGEEEELRQQTLFA